MAKLEEDFFLVTIVISSGSYVKIYDMLSL